MATFDFERNWRQLSEELITGMAEWRLQHPKATLTEIEAALDERLARLRAKMLQDAALVSAAAHWTGEGADPKQKPPECPHCQQPLISRGKRKRRLQTHGGKELELERAYGVCPACGTGLFPPR